VNSLQSCVAKSRRLTSTRYDILWCGKSPMRTDWLLGSSALQAYGSSRVNDGRVQQILHWPGSFETFRKVPTCLLYDSNGQVLAWGLEAKNAGPMPGTARCEWCVPKLAIIISTIRINFFRFKLFLEPHALRDESAIDPRLPQIPVSSVNPSCLPSF
jgi:hypothetical protein